MLREEKSSENGSYGVETSETTPSKLDSGQNMGNPDDKIGFSGNTSFDFHSKPSNSDSGGGQRFRFSVMDRVGFGSKPDESGSQELTLSYLCENPKSGGFNLSNSKGNLREEEKKWVERDFLQLSNDGESSKRREDAEEEEKAERGFSKKPKIEETQTLNLSLALPEVSLSLSAASNAAAPPLDCDAAAAVQLKASRSSVQCLANNNNNDNNNAQGTTCSDDFTAASLSYSYSQAYSHNPSCSMTRNSTEYYENSVGSRRRENDQIWNCGEGTNGSVHSRFKPIGGDGGVTLSNHGNGVVYAMLNRTRPPVNTGNSLYRAAAGPGVGATGSESSSFFPSELPAKPKTDLCSVDSMSKTLDHVKGFNSLEGMRGGHKVSRGERIVRDLVTEPVSVLSQLSRDLPAETIELAKLYLNCVISVPERKDELTYLQNLLERRSDLTRETLSKFERVHLEILVAVKFGLSEFVPGKVCLPTSELVEIFLFMRCRNVNCKSSLPVDDCDCKICSTKKGFCSQCMCPVCYNYDCASNTCSWVGCDACSHWCHAACGTEKNLIRPGPSLKGSAAGTTEMQFYCLGCGHASEMFGFVKDVFLCCAKNWGLETLIKELDCVRKIFKGSEDLKGKELYLKAAELITRLERRAISPTDACNVIMHFFTNKSDREDLTEFPTAGIRSKDNTASQGRSLNDVFSRPSSNLPQKSATMLQSLHSYDFHNSSHKPHISSDRHLEVELSGKLSENDGFDSLKSIIRLKETEARMFQNRADEARKEVETYRQMVQAKTEKLEEEYTEKLAKLCLQEADERRRKKLEELRILESSQSDYYKMKIRMQAEISGLVERMEATKQLWV